MKIQCDVCNKDEASVFCVADEAALCAACDHRVHHANKLAGKHQRFSLLQPSPKQIPLCDICQEKRALLFCQEDRAILCRDCDSSIHKANPQTQKHSRFLLTGVKLSPTTSLYSSSSSSTSTESSLSNASDSVPNPVSQIPTKPPPSFTTKTTPLMFGSAAVAPPPPPPQAAEPTIDKGGGNIQLSTSSISEYLIDTIPGWHVEDFLDSPPPCFFKTTENDVLSFLNADLGSNNLSTFAPENMGFWVPQTPSNPYFPTQIQSYQTINMGFGASSEGLKETTNMNKSSRQWSKEDNSFAVPQINPATAASKRSRNFW